MRQLNQCLNPKHNQPWNTLTKHPNCRATSSTRVMMARSISVIMEIRIRITLLLRRDKDSWVLIGVSPGSSQMKSTLRSSKSWSNQTLRCPWMIPILNWVMNNLSKPAKSSSTNRTTSLPRQNTTRMNMKRRWRSSWRRWTRLWNRSLKRSKGSFRLYILILSRLLLSIAKK